MPCYKSSKVLCMCYEQLHVQECGTAYSVAELIDFFLIVSSLFRFGIPNLTVSANSKDYLNFQLLGLGEWLC